MRDIDIIVAVVVSSLIILILISIIVISVFIGRQNRIKQQIKFAEARLNFEKELRKVEIEISENLMKQFSQELHDNIGHILTSMRISIENKKIDSPELKGLLSPIEEYLNDASNQLQLLSRVLNKEYIIDTGIVIAIQLEVDRLRQLKRFQIHFNYDLVVTNLSKNQEIIVFRIFQEIISNAMKHSNAKNVFINLSNQNGFILQVRDDGQGFDYESVVRSSKASGLRNILNRTKIAELGCLVESTLGNGCSYKIDCL